MRTVFVSDAHIKFNESAEDSERRERFESFLYSLMGSCDLLVMNGDIFDLWVPWKHVIIKEYFSLLQVLSALRKNGTKLIMTAGNHDFWFSDFLRDTIGIEIRSDSFVLEEGGQRFFISHGDRYTKNDLRYKLFRALVRNKLVKAIYTSLHPDFALEIGIRMSRSSRKRRVPRARRELMIKALEKAAEKILKEHKYDYVIFSHIHKPILKEFKEGIYGNCGDWVSHSSYLEYSDSELKLKEYKI